MQLRRDRSIRVYDQLTAGQFSTSARLSGACWQSVSGHHRGHFRCLTVATSSIGNWARRWQVSTCRNVKPVVLGYYISAEIARLGSAWSIYGISNTVGHNTHNDHKPQRRPTGVGSGTTPKGMSEGSRSLGTTLGPAAARRGRDVEARRTNEYEERVDRIAIAGGQVLAIRPENCVYG